MSTNEVAIVGSLPEENGGNLLKRSWYDIDDARMGAFNLAKYLPQGTADEATAVRGLTEDVEAMDNFQGMLATYVGAWSATKDLTRREASFHKKSMDHVIKAKSLKVRKRALKTKFDSSTDSTKRVKAQVDNLKKKAGNIPEWGMVGLTTDSQALTQALMRLHGGDKLFEDLLNTNEGGHLRKLMDARTKRTTATQEYEAAADALASARHAEACFTVEHGIVEADLAGAFPDVKAQKAKHAELERAAYDAQRSADHSQEDHRFLWIRWRTKSSGKQDAAHTTRDQERAAKRELEQQEASMEQLKTRKRDLAAKMEGAKEQTEKLKSLLEWKKNEKAAAEEALQLLETKGREFEERYPGMSLSSVSALSLAIEARAHATSKKLQTNAVRQHALGLAESFDVIAEGLKQGDNLLKEVEKAEPEGEDADDLLGDDNLNFIRDHYEQLETLTE